MFIQAPELPVIDAIKLGAPGCISATANINSSDISKVIDFCHKKDWDKAEELHKKVKKVRMLFQDYAPIFTAQKSLLAKKQETNLVDCQRFRLFQCQKRK